MGLICLMGIMGALVATSSPPAPPGFSLSPKAEIRSPKGAETFVATSLRLPGQVVPLPGNFSPTNHDAPVAVMDWRLPPIGPAGEQLFWDADLTLTNQVPMYVSREPAAPDTQLRVEWPGVAGKTYEIQMRLGLEWPWMAVGKSVAPSTAPVTGWAPMFPTERCGFVRVMSD